MLLIPYRSPTGLIQACQIRLTGKLAADKKRYLWLSLPVKTSASSSPFCTLQVGKSLGWRTSGDLPILVTEGVLKANVVAQLRSEFFAVANGGVNCSHDLIVNISRGKTLYLAFDNDYHENQMVMRQISKLLKLRLLDNQTNKTKVSTKILTWARTVKGIDDALLQGEKLEQISILDWFSALDQQSRLEVQKT